MNMDKERAIAVQKDLIHQLEDIRAIADRILAKLKAAQDEGKLSPTDGTVYGLLGLPVMSAVKNETEYNVLARRIILEEQLRKASGK